MHEKKFLINVTDIQSKSNLERIFYIIIKKLSVNIGECNRRSSIQI